MKFLVWFLKEILTEFLNEIFEEIPAGILDGIPSEIPCTTLKRIFGEFRGGNHHEFRWEICVDIADKSLEPLPERYYGGFSAFAIWIPRIIFAKITQQIKSGIFPEISPGVH